MTAPVDVWSFIDAALASELSPNVQRVAIYIARRVGTDPAKPENFGVAWPSAKKIGEVLRLQLRAVKGALATLEAEGWVEVHRDYAARRSGQANRYSLAIPEPAPGSGGGGDREDQVHAAAPVTGADAHPEQVHAGAPEARPGAPGRPDQVHGDARPGAPRRQIPGSSPLSENEPRNEPGERARAAPAGASPSGKSDRERERALEEHVARTLCRRYQEQTGKPWRHPDALTKALSGFGLRALAGDAERIRSLASWASANADPEAAFDALLTAFFADPYARERSFAVAILASDPARYAVARSTQPSAESTFRPVDIDAAERAAGAADAGEQVRALLVRSFEERRSRPASKEIQDRAAPQWAELGAFVLERARLTGDPIERVVRELVGGFMQSQRAKAGGYQVRWLWQNPNEYLGDREAPADTEEAMARSRAEVERKNAEWRRLRDAGQ